MEQDNISTIELKLKGENVVFLFFFWLFVESTLGLIKTWFLMLKFGLNFFSVPLLMRTFFSPWHRYWYGYSKGFDLALIFQTFFGNAMSRAIGMILRSSVIILGFCFEFFVAVCGFMVLVFWMVLPFLTGYFLSLGFKLI